MTGIGPVAVRQPRVRDREAEATDPDRIRFSPSILPPYMRCSKSIETLLPILYLKAISTGDFSEALAALLGKLPCAQTGPTGPFRARNGSGRLNSMKGRTPTPFFLTKAVWNRV
jgi:hypothetical protein